MPFKASKPIPKNLNPFALFPKFKQTNKRDEIQKYGM
jgi:hypothetical protein